MELTIELVELEKCAAELGKSALTKKVRLRSMRKLNRPKQKRKSGRCKDRPLHQAEKRADKLFVDISFGFGFS